MLTSQGLVSQIPKLLCTQDTWQMTFLIVIIFYVVVAYIRPCQSF